jgi:hypothetical protein
MKKDYYILIKRYGNSIEPYKTNKYFKPLTSDLSGTYHELRYRCTYEEFDKIVDDFYDTCESVLKVKEFGEVEEIERHSKMSVKEIKDNFAKSMIAKGYKKNSLGTWI